MLNSHPIGVVLAGGDGVRIGGDKLAVALRGRPLVSYPLAAMQAAVKQVAIITKADALVPVVDGAMVWIEPDEPVHPLLGVMEALAMAGGRPVLVCPMDYPFVTPQLLSALARARPAGRRAVVASFRGAMRPLLGCYQPSAAPLLAQAAHRGLPVVEAMAAIDPRLLEVQDETELFDVDTPDDLLQAAAMLDGLRAPTRT